MWNLKNRFQIFIVTYANYETMVVASFTNQNNRKEIMEKVILSSKLIIGNGIFSATEISLEEARQWVAENNPKNYCGHATVVLLGLSPANTRGQCDGYSQALCLSAKGRLEFGREYTLEEIEAIGVSFTLISCEESEP